MRLSSFELFKIDQQIDEISSLVDVLDPSNPVESVQIEGLYQALESLVVDLEAEKVEVLKINRPLKLAD